MLDLWKRYSLCLLVLAGGAFLLLIAWNVARWWHAS